jgi:hypothetical protein
MKGEHRSICRNEQQWELIRGNASTYGAPLVGKGKGG